MKKLISGLVLFAAMGAAVFAQGLKLGGYVNSGIGVIASDEEDFDAIVKAYAVDAWQNGYRFRLNGSWTNEEKNAGVNFRFQSQSKLTAGYLSLPYLYGWVQFLNDIFTVSGGIVDDSTWTTADFWIGDDAGEGLGALLKAAPVTGLDLGFGAYLASQQSGGGNNVLGSGGIDFSTVALKIGDVKYVYSGSFTLPEVFRVGASFRWKNKAGWDAASANPGYGGRHESSALFGDVRLLAVKDLTAVAAFQFNKIEDFDNKGDILFSETFGYKIDSLGIGLNAAQFFYNRTAVDPVSGDTKKVDHDPGLFFNLWGSYAIGKVVPRLDLVYFIGGQSRPANNAFTYDRHEGYGPQKNPGLADVDDDYSVFSARPSVKFNLAANTFIEIGDMINFDSGNFDGSYADSGDTKKKDRLTNVFYVDFKWSF
jgi:hypothetical protein